MSVVQPPRKRKCFLKSEQETIASSLKSPSVSPIAANGISEGTTAAANKSKLTTTSSGVSSPKSAKLMTINCGGSNASSPVVPPSPTPSPIPDAAFASFIQHAIELAAAKQAQINSLIQERDNLFRRLSSEEKVKSLQQPSPGLASPDCGAVSVKTEETTSNSNSNAINYNNNNNNSSKQTAGLANRIDHNGGDHSAEPPSFSSSPNSSSKPNSSLKQHASTLEQRNRELQRNLDLAQRDLKNCTELLKSQSADNSKKDATLLEKDKELEKLRNELSQTRLRLDAFVKSASEQAILAKNLQEELNNEKEQRVQVEGKLRAANECVRLGMQFETKLKTITCEKAELEREMAKLQTENLRLVASYSGSVPPAEVTATSERAPLPTSSDQEQEQLQQPTAPMAAVLTNLVSSSSSSSSSEKVSQTTQTEEVIAKERFVKNDEEISRLQGEIDALQRQLAIVISADTKFFDPNVEIVAQSSTPVPAGEPSEVPSSPIQLQSENSLLKRKVAELEDELEKRKTTMEWHHKTWLQKCEVLHLMEEKVRDRDIQCAKYHLELQAAEKKVRTLVTEKISQSSTASSPNNSVALSQPTDRLYTPPSEF